MKTVSTLAATASIVGVSAVGYAIGRPDLQSTPEPHPNKRKASSDLDHYSMATQVTTRVASTPAHTSTFSVSANNNNRSIRRQSNDGRPLLHKTRKTDGGSALAEAADASHQVPSVVEPCPTGSLSRTTLQSRPSWVRRLSSRSSQPSTRTSSPQPLSPALSLSNGSASFSNTGSTVPFLGGHTPALLPPNKLVKRSLSQRASDGPPLSRPSSKTPTLKRPATSHQRSATLQLRSHPLETSSEEYWCARDGNFVEPSLQEPAHQEPAWRSYFGVKVAKEGTMSKKRTSSGDTRHIRRIFPDEKYRPTLLMAKDIAPSSIDVDESLGPDEDSILFGSRPATPFRLSGLFLSPQTMPVPNSEGTVATPGPWEAPAPERRHKRSFSDLLSSGSSSWKLRSGRLSNTKSTQRISRVNSAPLLAMGNRRSQTVEHEQERPAKRRDFSDPLTFQQNAYASSNSRPQLISIPRPGSHSDIASSAQPQPEILNVYTSVNGSTPFPSLQATSSAGSAYPAHVMPSPTLTYSGHHPSQHSAAPSEHALTLVGSDSDARGMWSGDDDDTDVTADTAFDSLQTRTTRSTSGPRGRHIGTIFDEPLPQPLPKIEFTTLQDLLPRGTFDDATATMGLDQSIAEEDESSSTSARPVGDTKRNATAPVVAGNDVRPSVSPPRIPSSPSNSSKGMPTKALGWDHQVEDVANDENDWYFDEDEDQDVRSLRKNDSMSARDAATMSVLQPKNTLLTAQRFEHPPTTPKRLSAESDDKDKERNRRSNPFDWSEQQPTDKTPGDRTPPRPKTVHGKKDADGRGSRSAGRRVPSAIHVRSQSVPVVPDMTGKRETVRNKFGTWGVGTKGVTEDWDDDFDFTTSNKPQTQSTDIDERRVDSGYSMIVPLTIKRQQTNVLANIGLLREWGMLIEELKELRIRAMSVGMLEGQYVHMWREVDAMIDLADQEAEDQAAASRSSPPSSPGLDMDAFDEEPIPVIDIGRPRRRSGVLLSDPSIHGVVSLPPTSHRHNRKSILSPDDVFSGFPPVLPIQEEPTPQATPQKPTTPITRPRKDSEAVARSVIEALQNRNVAADSILSLQPVPATKKVPFDTATLRHIVPYVQSLVRKVKDALREEEGLYSSPDKSPKQLEPPFSQMFHSPLVQSPFEESPSSRKGRLSKVSSPSPATEDGYQGLDYDLSTKMRLMTVT